MWGLAAVHSHSVYPDTPKCQNFSRIVGRTSFVVVMSGNEEIDQVFDVYKNAHLDLLSVALSPDPIARTLHSHTAPTNLVTRTNTRMTFFSPTYLTHPK